MGAINVLADCVSGGGNTGVPLCAFNPGLIGGGLITPNGYEITDADIASGLQGKLEQDILADRSDRIYPFFNVVGITDNSEDITTETQGYGGIDFVRSGFTNWLFRTKSSVCLNAQMQKFNAGDWAFLPVDRAGVIMGEKTTTGVRAVDLELIYTDNWKANSGTVNTLYQTRVVFDATRMNSNPGFITTNDLGFSPKDLKGLLNVAIVKVTRVAGVLTVRALAGCSSTNLYDDYDTELANVALWVARNAATGNQISITSVTADPNSSGFIVTLNTADTDYTAGAVTLSLASPITLDTAGVSGFESNVATITV